MIRQLRIMTTIPNSILYGLKSEQLQEYGKLAPYKMDQWLNQHVICDTHWQLQIGTLNFITYKKTMVILEVTHVILLKHNFSSRIMPMHMSNMVTWSQCCSMLRSCLTHPFYDRILGD